MSQHALFYLDGTLTICREGDVFLGNAQIRLLKQVLLTLTLFFVMLFKRLIFNYIQNLINFLGGATK